MAPLVEIRSAAGRRAVGEKEKARRGCAECASTGVRDNEERHKNDAKKRRFFRGIVVESDRDDRRMT